MKDIVVKPRAELLKRLYDFVPRIMYQPCMAKKKFGNSSYSIKEAYQSILDSEEPHKANVFVFDDFFLMPLKERMKKELHSYFPVGVRGTVLNIGKEGLSFSENGYEGYVKTLEEFLHSGSERDHRTDVPMLGYDGDEIPYRSKQWCLQSTDQLRERVKPEQQKFLFPAIVVYDRNYFDEETTQLPHSPEKKANVILCAYILDYIMPPLHAVKKQ